MSIKLCPQCDQVKALTEFARNRTRVDGRSGWCRDCTREWNADYTMGVRRREIAGRRNERGILICICPVARPAPKCCATCGWPVVAAMHPDVQAHAAERHVPVANQVIEPC